MGLLASFTGGLSRAQVEAEIGAATEQHDLIVPAPTIVFASGAAPTANLAYFQKFRVGKPRTLTTVYYHPTTSSGNVNAGVFAKPGGAVTALARSGSTAAGTAGTIVGLTLVGGADVEPGVDYWLAFAADNATIQVLRNVSYSRQAAFLDEEIAVVADNFALADGVTLALPSAAYVPWLAVK